MMKGEKNVPKVRFPGFTDDWEQRKLGECCNIFAGGTPSTSQKEYWENGDVNWLPSGNIQDCYIYESDIKTKITKLGLEKSSAKIIKRDTALLAMTGATCGKSAYLTCDSSANQSVMAFETDLLDSKMLFYIFQKNKDYILKFQAGGAQAGINKDTCQNLSFMFPQIEEQKEIGAFLMNLDSLITLQQRKLDAMKEYKKGMLQNMFPKEGEPVPEVRFPGFTGEWERRKLGDISDFITKGATPTTYGFDWVDNGILFFRNDAIKDNQFVYGDYSFISEEANEVLKRSEITGDDILIAITGDIGKVGIVPKIIKKANINQHTARVRVLRDAVPYFVYQSLATDIQQRKYKKIKTGLSMPQLSLEQIRDTMIYCPSIDEQFKISDTLTNLDTLISLHQRKLEAMKEYKKGMLQQMFV